MTNGAVILISSRHNFFCDVTMDIGLCMCLRCAIIRVANEERGDLMTQSWEIQHQTCKVDQMCHMDTMILLSSRHNFFCDVTMDMGLCMCLPCAMMRVIPKGRGDLMTQSRDIDD